MNFIKNLIFGSISNVHLEETLNRFNPYDVGIKFKRFGKDGDGGYVLPEDLARLNKFISIGCGGDTSFEDEVFALTQIPFFIFDSHVNFPKIISNSEHKFIDGWVGEFSKATDNKTPVYTLSQALQSCFSSDLDEGLLKLDIESSEYSALLQTDISVLTRFRIIVIELHRLNELLHSTIFCKLLNEILDRLNSKFIICHFHPNNSTPSFPLFDTSFPSTVEITWIRRDRVNEIRKLNKTYRKHLDQNNSFKRERVNVTFPIKA